MADVLVASGLRFDKGNILTLSNGHIYLIGFNGDQGTALNVYYSTDSGANWSYRSSVNGSTIFSGETFYNLQSVQCAKDASDNIHVVVQAATNGTSKTIMYNVYTPSSNSWGTWEVILAAWATGSNAYNASVDIAIDSASKPFIVFQNWTTSMGSNYSQVYVTNKVSGTWSTPTLISSTATANHYHPTISTYYSALNSQERKTIVYSRGDTNYIARTFTTSWQAESSLSSAAVMPNEGMAIVTTNNGSQKWVWKASSGGGASFGAVSIATTVVLSAHDATYGNGVFAGSHMQTDNQSFIIYVTTDYKVMYRLGPGEVWGTPVTLYTGSSSSNCRVMTEHQYYHNSVPAGRVNYVYTRGSDTYFGYWTSAIAPTTVTVGASALATSPQAVIPWNALLLITPTASTFRLRSRILVKTVNVSWARFYRSENQGLFIVPSRIEFGLNTPDPVVVLSSTTAQPEIASFGLLTLDPILLGLYAGILKYWTGSAWVNALLKTYVGGSWQSKPLKIYLDGEWKTIDISG